MKTRAFSRMHAAFSLFVDYYMCNYEFRIHVSISGDRRQWKAVRDRQSPRPQKTRTSAPSFLTATSLRPALIDAGWPCMLCSSSIHKHFLYRFLRVFQLIILNWFLIQFITAKRSQSCKLYYKLQVLYWRTVYSLYFNVCL